MNRQPAMIPVTAVQAILGMCHEFDDIYAVYPERLPELIEEAYGPEGEYSKNHVIRSIRVLRRIGFTREMLLMAVTELGITNAFSPRMHRPAVNPYSNQVKTSAWSYPHGWKPLSVMEKAKGISIFFDFDRTKALSEITPSSYQGNEFHDLVAVRPSVLAKWWNIKDPYGRNGYPKMLARLANLVKMAYGRTSHHYGFYKTVLDLHEQYHSIEMLRSVRDILFGIDLRSNGAFMVIPGQLGMRWRGSSMERAIWHTENVYFPIDSGWREFVLPSYLIMFELLSDPSRLCGPGTLAMYCAGDIVLDRSHYHCNGLSLAFGADNLHIMPMSRTRPDTMFGVVTGIYRKF